MTGRNGRDGEACRRRRPRLPGSGLVAAVAVTLAAAVLGGCGTRGANAAPSTEPSAKPSTPASQQPVAPQGTSASSGSDAAMPVGDIPGWHQIFADDFRTDVPVGGFSGCSNEATRICTGLPPSVQSKWWAYPDGWSDTTHAGVYSPSTVISIENGEMHLHLYTVDGVHHVGAPVPKIPDPVGKEGGQLYGRYELRFMVQQPTAGFKVAWLLWPDSESFPADGEIDFPEGALNGPISAYMHRQNATLPHDQDAYNTAIGVSSGWHTAVTEWTASGCRFILDGKVIGTSTGRIPNTPMHWVLQSETWGVPAAGAVADIYIAWVAIYQPA
ncbi:MAG TPA: glycoside hydrolase family 16 protein [Actinospica sp.]|nr:glycoside hydrolase family 16 protein [Actinospica sp.]